MTSYSDEALTQIANNETNKGEARAAKYLLLIPEELREATRAAGEIMANHTSGYRYTDGVHLSVQRVRNGWTLEDLTYYIKNWS